MDVRGASLGVVKAIVPRTVLTRIVMGALPLPCRVCTQCCPESAAT